MTRSLARPVTLGSACRRALLVLALIAAGAGAVACGPSHTPHHHHVVTNGGGY